MDAGIDLDLDLTDGRGVLPLPAHVVEAVFRGQRLTWSVRAAVQVLAGIEAAEPVPAAVASPWRPAYHPSGEVTRADLTPHGPRRLPRLIGRPAVDQLALF
jgi:hypothetical protein